MNKYFGILILIPLAFLFGGFKTKFEKPKLDFLKIQEELEWFIQKINSEKTGTANFEVFVIKIMTQDISKIEYCTTMGYISDSVKLEVSGKFEGYLIMFNEIVLVQIDEKIKENFEIINLKLIKGDFWGKIRPIIFYPGGMTGTSEGYVCCFYETKIAKVFYDDEDEIPENYRIFKYPNYNSKSIIEMDSAAARKYFESR